MSMDTIPETGVSTEAALVQQTPREIFLAKLLSFSEFHLTAREREKLKKRRVRFVKHFIKLAGLYFSPSKDQLKQLDDKELEMLSDMINRKAFWGSLVVKICTFGIPLIGWFGIASEVRNDNVPTWNYRSDYAYLRKICGEKFFPHEKLREQLN